MNHANTFALPEVFLKKNKPENIVGKNIRLAYLLANWQNFLDQ